MLVDPESLDPESPLVVSAPPRAPVLASGPCVPGMPPELVAPPFPDAPPRTALQNRPCAPQPEGDSSHTDDVDNDVQSPLEPHARVHAPQMHVRPCSQVRQPK